MLNNEFPLPILLALPVLCAYLLLIVVLAVLLARENLFGALRQFRQRLHAKR